MTVEMMTMDNAPLWLNVVIWMAAFWQYFLAGFIPCFYIVVTKLFGFPLLQRWSNEVVIMLYPTKASFGKITQQYEPYFRKGKGIYWYGEPLSPEEHISIRPRNQEIMEKNKLRYEELMAKPEKSKKELKELNSILKQEKVLEKRKFVVSPVNPIHIFTHAVNQPVYNMERRQSKVDEILNNDCRPKNIKPHGVWLLQNPKLHFHRHYLIVVSPDKKRYKLVPVRERQQFSIGFWHSIGISLTQEVPVEQTEQQESSSGSNGGKTKLLLSPVTTNTVLQQMKEVQDYQNFSASRAYMILFKRRAPLETNFEFWISGSTNPVVFLALGGMVAAIAVIFLFFHGMGGSPPTGAH